MLTQTHNMQRVIPICYIYNSNYQILGTRFIIFTLSIPAYTPLLRPHFVIHTGLIINMFSGARSEETDL